MSSPASPGKECRDETWESAYLRFETPQEETRKFLTRLRSLGAESWDRGGDVVELFCGRGGGLLALEQLGFRNLEGVDLSPNLLAQYMGPARCQVADCRTLPFPDDSKDVLVVQGGLHHLDSLPGDLERTLSEARRVLRPGGRFIAIEPWLTPFLRFVHAVCRSRIACRAWPRLHALSTMIRLEERTYFNWLSRPEEILGILNQGFRAEIRGIRWGKLHFLGRKA